jgi:type III secretory pathway lipoprotein EscJ
MSRVTILLALSTVLCCGNEGSTAGTQTTSAQPGVEQLLGGSLIPGRTEERTLREHALAGELARTLEQLDGVAAARVHLSLADRSLLAVAPGTVTSAAVVVRSTTSRPAPDPRRIRELAAAAIPGLEPDAVRVFVSSTAPAPVELVDLGPFQVTAATAGRARGLVGGLLAVCLVLAGGLIFAGFRLRRLRRGAQS